MANGANSIHKELRDELESYIKSQYLGKSPVLMEALGPVLDKEGILYQKPYLESSPAYKSIEDGIQKSEIPQWMKEYFAKLTDTGIGVYQSPFIHQVQALENAVLGKDLFVATGTGSGKTECFMWPILAKLANEARNQKQSWEQRGTRIIIMYPMNALVSDQVGRLRRLIGDTEDKFVQIYRNVCGKDVRRPQFGMYTGRTPYPGEKPIKTQDKRLLNTLKAMTEPKSDSEKAFLEKLRKEGKIPSKKNMPEFLDRLSNGCHVPDSEDAELITRFEMQQFCPDILITNYSMLEYMLLRPREKKIWEDTRKWLDKNKENKLLFVIDEAHMYRGSSGGEVALLIRRLFHKLGIARNRVQFILTTASMPQHEDEAVKKFARGITAAGDEVDFCFLTGEREDIQGVAEYDIPFDKLLATQVNDFDDDNKRIKALCTFWHDIKGAPSSFPDLGTAYDWMYSHLTSYRPFNELIRACRGTAISLHELAKRIFPEADSETAMNATGVLLAIAPLAKNRRGSVLFPVRMHMLFKGIKGIYACTNPNCPHGHSDGKLRLGEIFISDGQSTCPECGSVVYELHNDRRCGALFYKGYIIERDMKQRRSAYLWHYPGQLMVDRMKEIYLFIPEDDFVYKPGNSKTPIRPCYMDIHSGFIYCSDDSMDGKPGIRKLYYCEYATKGHPDIMTFTKCPHCSHQLSEGQLTSFSTRGNQSFFNLIKAQFQNEPAVSGKDNDLERFPNQGRKVLLFSDSRQRAAKLARDMSDASDFNVARQLFAVALDKMEQTGKGNDYKLNDFYDYFCQAAAEKNIQLYHEEDKEKFKENCQKVSRDIKRANRRNRKYQPVLKMTNAPDAMKEDLLRLYAGGYNTLCDTAISWIEATDAQLWDSVDELEDEGIEVSKEDFIEIFNAWMLYMCDAYTALGNTIADKDRLQVRKTYKGYGAPKDWKFPKVMQDVLGWTKQKELQSIWKQVLTDHFLDTSQSDANGNYYVDLERVKPMFDADHTWYRCEKCSEITPYLLRKRCPSCGGKDIHKLNKNDMESLRFWRKPIEEVLLGNQIHVMDIEEHTAQLSHKDQRDDMWSKTEQYELRFQDFVQEGQTPVDILSSTTTMEVGIDIGSLVAVGMRNVPPMRENYQQRAGRAGRRGASLSTIVTFCEDGPHDTLYFNNPEPMFRGDPRKPWIDVQSPKLIKRHISIVLFEEYLSQLNSSLDTISAALFLDNNLEDFLNYAKKYEIADGDLLLPGSVSFNSVDFMGELEGQLRELTDKWKQHPELFGVNPFAPESEKHAKSLLDALYEEGIIPTYSFPKNVVSTYITDTNGKTQYVVDRALDVAIGEYAPGRGIVVDKKTYQIGGFYYPGSEKQKGRVLSPASKYMDDPNYSKEIRLCKECGWFGLASEPAKKCPFCGNPHLEIDARPMLRPWGFAPKDAVDVPEAQLDEQYSYVQQPLYSTVPDDDEMHPVSGTNKIYKAIRSNQRIIMMNKGPENEGFMVCKDCGAAMPGDNPDVLKNVGRPYRLSGHFGRKACHHTHVENVNLGYDFVTDMLVLEFQLDDKQIETRLKNNPWLGRAAQSLAEALRLVASKELDIEFMELVTGYRQRGTSIDIYLYDSLSSGAGYAVSIAKQINVLLDKAKELLSRCDCDSACHKCLKHYRNQHVHGILDRLYALQLLDWGIHGNKDGNIPVQKQWDLLRPLASILKSSGCIISEDASGIKFVQKDDVKKVVVYPAMWAEPFTGDTVYISEALIKYAKPVAVQKLIGKYDL